MTTLSPTELRTIREDLDLTQSDLANRLSCSRRTVHRWESGETTPSAATVLVLQRLVREPAAPAVGGPDASDFTFIDLFAGIGGMRLGFAKHGGRCVYTSEWDRFCRQTYRANFPTGEEIAGDIQEVRSGDIPQHDLLLAGFPCQPFSLAGVSKKNSLGRPHGFADETQGTLFFDIARILRDHEPTAFLLENVKHLRNHDRGRTMKVILRTLEEELGYRVTTRVIDARSFLPQHRQRVFIAGFREDAGFDLNDLDLPDPKNGPRLNSVLHPEDGSEEAESPYTRGELAVVSAKYTLSDHLWSYLQEYARRHRERGNGFGFGLVGLEDTTPHPVRPLLQGRFRDPDSSGRGQSASADATGVCAPDGVRRSGAESQFEIPVSDTQAYKQFGNAVAVPVVDAIARVMAPHIATTVSNPYQLEFTPRLRIA